MKTLRRTPWLSMTVSRMAGSSLANAAEGLAAVAASTLLLLSGRPRMKTSGLP